MEQVYGMIHYINLTQTLHLFNVCVRLLQYELLYYLIIEKYNWLIS